MLEGKRTKYYFLILYSTSGEDVCGGLLLSSTIWEEGVRLEHFEEQGYARKTYLTYINYQYKQGLCYLTREKVPSNSIGQIVVLKLF